MWSARVWVVLGACVSCGAGCSGSDDDDSGDTPAAAAGRGAGGAGADGNEAGNPGASGAGTGGHQASSWAQPVCVYFEAYQENYEPDRVSDIVENARGCYVLIDPFGSREARDAIPALKEADNRVGCYMSVGTCEDWRDDYDAMRDHCVNEPWGDWEGEYFVDRPNAELIGLMQARIDALAEWGCELVEFDNMDWAFDEDYRSEYGFTATPEEGIAYFQALCDHVHERGMQCMAKNTAEGAEDFDGGTFESYSDELDWWEHSHLERFLAAGQLGVIVHYDEADCPSVYSDYRLEYGDRLSFICEDSELEAYWHFNEQGR